MAKLKYKTRGNSNPQGKPRVYFCCHSKDFNKYFESVSDEILAKQNCTVWYIDEAVVRDEDFFADLKQMQLFVMPVTANLLYTENEALDIEFKFAVENHIPILPLMQEVGLEEPFNQKCEDLQFLNKYDADITAISYDEKLQKYLESILIGDELAEKIRAAFDAYVFLSYRKKDRRYAQELMRLIHKNEFCRDIAIWYDEFLVPGENFNSSIKEAIKKSKLFVLAVTPNLINESNYIMTAEYPMAKQERKPILPAELVPTDRKQLSEKYTGIPNPTNAHNESEFSEALLESIINIGIKESNNSPEHNFFIGLAYLSGIDVEVDFERAVRLITSASASGLIEATEKLYDIYINGIGVKTDYKKVLEIAQQLVEYYNKRYGEEHEKSLESTYKLACALLFFNEYQKSMELYEKVYTLGCKILCESHPLIYNSISQLLPIYDKLKEFSRKAEAEEKKYLLEQKIFGGENLYSINKIVDSYIKINNISKASKWFDCAYELSFKKEYENSESFIFELFIMANNANELGAHHKAKVLFERVLSQLHDEEELSLYAKEGLAFTYDDLGEYANALSLYKKINEEFYNIYGRDDQKIFMYMAHTYFKMGNYYKASVFTEKAYTLVKAQLGEDSNFALFLLNDLALIFGAIGDYHKYSEIKKTVYERSCKKLNIDNFGITDSQSEINLAFNKTDDFCKEFALQEVSNKIISRVLDIEHPYFLISLNNMEYPHSKANIDKEELRAAKIMYDLRREKLGEVHVATMISLSTLALFYQSVGDYKTALSFYEKLSAQTTDTYGANHRKTLKIVRLMKDVLSKIESD